MSVGLVGPGARTSWCVSEWRLDIFRLRLDSHTERLAIPMHP